MHKLRGEEWLVVPRTWQLVISSGLAQYCLFYIETSLPPVLFPILMLLLELQRFIIPAAVLIISFLSFSSQLLFYHISPGPLGPREAAVFNVLIACVFICYARACLTDPGKISSQGIKNGDGSNGRWCTKCDAPKPPRSHHCRVCARFVF